MSSIREDIVLAHLKQLAPDGLPHAWFADVAETPRKEEQRVPIPESPPPVTAPASEISLLDTTADDYSKLGMDQLREIALGCVKCRLCEERNKVVFGVGKIDSPALVFVGEGPGADEDRIGEPFVGKAGQLLTAAITKGMGLRREDVYIANVVKCRPPGNRAPLPDETAACTPYLYRQLEIIRPKVIVTLGQPAQLALSGVNVGITKLRGNWQNWRGVPLMPTFHPAYILRSPSAKKDFWADLQAVMGKLAELEKGAPN